MLAVDRDMVLIAEGRDRDVDRRQRAIRLRLGFRELDRPARVPILVPELGRPLLPGGGDAPGLDLLLLLLRVALARRRDQAGIDDLPGHRDVTRLAQHRLEAREERFDRAGFRQPFPEQPDRPGVRHAIRKSQAEEAHEGEPVADQELRPFIR